MGDADRTGTFSSARLGISNQRMDHFARLEITYIALQIHPDTCSVRPVSLYGIFEALLKSWRRCLEKSLSIGRIDILKPTVICKW